MMPLILKLADCVTIVLVVAMLCRTVLMVSRRGQL